MVVIYSLISLSVLTSCKGRNKSTKEIQDEILQQAVPEVNVAEISTVNTVSGTSNQYQSGSSTEDNDVTNDEGKKQNITMFDEMKPVFMAVCDCMKDNYYQYTPYRYNYYFNALSYLAEYCKDDLKDEYKSDGGNVTLSQDALRELSTAAFASRPYGYEEVSPEDMPEFFVPDEEFENFTLPVRERSVESVEIVKAVELPCDEYDVYGSIYDVEIKVGYKECEKNFTLTMVTNELKEYEDVVMYNYSIQNIAARD